MLKVIVASMLVLVCCLNSRAQLPSSNPLKTHEFISESLEESGRTPEDFISLLEVLDAYRENPLNLNQAAREELEKIVFLTDFQIQSLLDYRREHGAFLTIYELQLVFGFDSLTVANLLPYVDIGQESSVKRLSPENIARYGSHEIILKEQRVIQIPEGYRDEQGADSAGENSSRYLGNRDRLLLKYRFHYQDRLYLGLTMEKDPGEEFFTGSNSAGFDFYSGYIEMNDLGPVKKILLGDFRVTAGQGLTLWTEPAFGKSPDPSTLYKRQEFLKKQGSADENGFFRGVAVSVALRNFSLFAFFSSRFLDANITDTLPSGMPVFSTFLETGYHRTRSEINDEKTIRETTAGTRLMYSNSWLRMGTTLVRYYLDGMKQQPDLLYKKYDFWGSSSFNAGIDYTLSFQKIQAFGEASYGNHSWATLHGMSWDIHHQVSFSILYRYYEPGYYARYSGALSENSSATNENAFYFGTVLHPFRHCKITGYVDFFRFPWLTFSVQQPSAGSESMLQADFELSDKFECYLRFRNKSESISYTTADNPIKQTQRRVTSTYRFHYDYSVSKNLQLRSRVEFKTVRYEATDNANGFLLFQDLVYRFSRIPVRLSLRYLLFRTDDYAARIYAYEDDVLYSYTNPAFSDEGYRSYALIRYDAAKNLTFWIKWGQTGYNGVSVIGTGSDEIEGNAKTEVKLQARWTF